MKVHFVEQNNGQGGDRILCGMRGHASKTFTREHTTCHNCKRILAVRGKTKGLVLERWGYFKDKENLRMSDLLVFSSEDAALRYGGAWRDYNRRTAVVKKISILVED